MANYFTKPRVVYGLRRPGTIAIRYVGQTCRGRERLRKHMTKPHHAELRSWIEELRLDGVEPEMLLLADAKDYPAARRAEDDWIASLSIVFGDQLLNKRSRGDFVPMRHLERSAASLRRQQIANDRRERWLTHVAEWNSRQAARRILPYEHNGERMTLSQWAKMRGISRERMRQRVAACERRGVDIAEALNTPAGTTMPSFCDWSNRFHIRISQRNAMMVKDVWFDGKVHVIRRGEDWPQEIRCATFRNVIAAEAESRGGKCKFRILCDCIMFVHESKNTAAA